MLIQHSVLRNPTIVGAFLLGVVWVAPSVAQTPGFDNLLEIAPSQAAPGTESHLVHIVGHNVQDVSGYTIVLDYDEQYLEAVDVNVADTLSEAIGAEFVNFQDYPDEGFFVLGVLLDLLPPYDGQVIPALPELDLVYANFVCDILPEAADVDEVALTFVDGLGDPPLANMFVIGVASIAPTLQSGVIDIVENVPFLRGDANESGVIDIADAVRTLMIFVEIVDPPSCVDIVDINDDGAIEIADAIYLLSYLFQGGPVVPAPFPVAGLDPTPDDLICE